MDRNVKTDKQSIGKCVLVIFLVLIVIVSVAIVIYSFVGIFGTVMEFGGILNEYFAHENATDKISCGIIIDKEIVNGHTVNGGGGIVAGPNGSGVVIGGNKEYIPTEYRLYVKAEYEIDDEVFEGERYFDVPAEVYQAYNIGDFFDSQNLYQQTAAPLCPNCGAECDTPFCGQCGTPMNPEG